MRLFAIAAALLTLAACTSTATATQPIGAKAASGGVTLIATLASVGSADELTAAPLTRLELLNHNIARDVEAGRISPQTARSAGVKADDARAKLARAIVEIDLGAKAAGLALIGEANQLIATGDTIRTEGRLK